MKRIQKLLMLSCILFVAGCTAEPDFNDGLQRQIPINIYGRVNQLTTKATDSGFEDKDALGLYAVNYTDHNNVAGELLTEGNQADNAKYVYDASDAKWTATSRVYYKDIETSVDLYLYYPWQNTISDVNAFTFEVARDQSTKRKNATPGGYEASDFLWGKAPSIYPTENSISVTLNHMMAGCTVALREGSGFEAGEWDSVGMSIIMQNTTRKCAIDLSTGAISPIGEAQSTGIVMLQTVDDSFKCVVVPQSVSANTDLFAITIDKVTYSYKDGNVANFVAGKMTTYTITVNKRQPSGDYELELTGISINPWVEDRNPVQIEARQYYVVNVETPGTLGQLIEAAGKNPAKIKNLKVTGNVNADDFYFMREQMEILEAVNMKECRLENDEIPDRAFKSKGTLCLFVYPDTLQRIGKSAFWATLLSGAQLLPESLTIIDGEAFAGTIITSVVLPYGLTYIGDDAFGGCGYLTGDLLLPDSIEYVGSGAFRGCNFNGRFHLSERLTGIEGYSFANCGSFYGDLILPDNCESVDYGGFHETHFTGRLVYSNLKSIAPHSFRSCSLRGELIIPDGITEIPSWCFFDNKFSGVTLPPSIKFIRDNAFGYLSGKLIVNEGCLSIGPRAFLYSKLTEIELPSSLKLIDNDAFEFSYYVTHFTCKAITPPTVGNSGTFYGVGKDNLTLEVPASAVKLYEAASFWSDFKRISAHYDFSISRRLMRSLNHGKTRTFILRAPAGYDWSIQSKPDWVTVSPSSGTGITEVSVTIQEMPRTSTPMYDLDDINNQIGVGRNGEIVFMLDEKNYTSTMTVEQYDYDYSDGQLMQLQKATKGNGIDIFFTGDGYDAADIANGKLYEDSSSGLGYFFGLEPYATYKDYFNVYAVVAESDETGISTSATVISTKFDTEQTLAIINGSNQSKCFEWIQAAKPSSDLSKSLVILLLNATLNNGRTYLYANGSALSCCPVHAFQYPYDYRGIIQHEAGGHGFGKLLDEYIDKNAYAPEIVRQTVNAFHNIGWGQNVSAESDINKVPWTHLIFHPSYSDNVDIYEGAYEYAKGLFRSEPISCMVNNIPYYNAISRQAIVERIMEYAGEEFTLEKFYAKDNNSFGTKASFTRPDWGDYPSLHTEASMPVFMGEHPNL